MPVRLFTFIGLLLLLASCNCSAPLEITSIQKSDKKLACKDIILEINEAEHYRDQAKAAKGISMMEVLMPTCWVSGYIDGNSALKSADARINYLGNIYDLLDCGGTSKSAAPPAKATPAPRPSTRVAPPPRPPVQYAPPPQGYPPMGMSPYPPAGAAAYPPANNKNMNGFNPYASAANANKYPSAEQFEKPIPLGNGEKRPYRRVPIDEAHGDAWLHEHTDREGKVYTHSHPHRGPHQHAEDMPGAPAP